MNKELLTEYMPINGDLTLSGAVDGPCARCLGRGKCPRPFQHVTGYHFEGVHDNILADVDVKNEWKIERLFDSCMDAYLLKHYKTGEEFLFHNRNGQFFGEVEPSDSSYKCLLNSAQYQKLGMTKNAIERMIRVEKLHQSLSYVGLQYLSRMIQNNLLLECSLTTSDVSNYQKYMHERSCRGCAFGKRRVDGQYSRPEEISYVGIGHLVCIDIMYITTHLKIKKKPQTLSALICVDAFSGYKSLFWIKNRTEKKITAGVQRCIDEYKNNGHTIRAIKMDNEGATTKADEEGGISKLEKFLKSRKDPIELLRSLAGRHVVEIETQIRYIKSLWRATILGVSFGIKCPRFLYSYALADCVSTSNMIITSGNDYVSPAYMFNNGRKPNYRSYADSKFAEVVTFTNLEKDVKDEDEKAQVGIIIGRNAYKNTLSVYNLKTQRIVTKGLRDCRLYDTDGEIRKLIRKIDSNQITDRLSVPKLFIKRPNEGYIEVLDEIDNDVDQPDFHAMESESIANDAVIADDNFYIRARNELLPEHQITHMLENVNLDADNDTDILTNNTEGKIEDVTYEHSEDESVPIIQSPNVEAEDILSLQKSNDDDHELKRIAARKRLRGTISILEQINGRGTTPNFLQIRKKKKNRFKVLLANIKVKRSKELFGVENTEEAVLKEILQMEDKDVWRMLLHEELLAIKKSETVNILPSSLFLKDKYDASGNFEKLKARLVCCGNFQRNGFVDEKGVSEIESPTISFNTLLAVLSVASKKGLCKRVYDISGAYLNADLENREFMRLGKDVTNTLLRHRPEYEKYLIGDTFVVELKKALYGLKQASRAWYDLLSNTLINKGYLRSHVDPCLFIKYDAPKKEHTYVLVYVDDILVLSPNEEGCENIKIILSDAFKDITEKKGDNLSFIGLEIFDDVNKNIKVNQKGYIKKLLDEYSIESSVKYPSDDEILADEISDICDKNEYLKLVIIIKIRRYLI